LSHEHYSHPAKEIDSYRYTIKSINRESVEYYQVVCKEQETEDPISKYSIYFINNTLSLIECMMEIPDSVL